MSRAPLAAGLFLLASLSLAVALLLNRRLSNSPVHVNMAATDPGPGEPDPDSLNLAIAPIYSSRASLSEYSLLADYLGKRVGKRVALVQRRTYAEINELLRRGSLAGAIMCTGAYLEAQGNGIPLVGIAMPVVRGERNYHSVIIVRSDTSFARIEDLAGASFAFTDPHSLSGHLYPHWLLLERGHDPGIFFKRTILSYGHDASIRAVMKGIVDAASVDSLIYEEESSRDPGVVTAVRIIHTSPPLPLCPIVTPSSLDLEVRKGLATALIGMKDTEEGRAILGRIGIDGFEEPTSEDLSFAMQIHDRVDRYLHRR